jgi:hypothetical protein
MAVAAEAVENTIMAQNTNGMLVETEQQGKGMLGVILGIMVMSKCLAAVAEGQEKREIV